mgnify:CR=1 FL=1
MLIFLNSAFFVLGFSMVFSLVGVLLQSILSNVAYTAQNWLGYIGGSIIIFFGLFLLGLIKIEFLEREHKLKVKRKFKYSYVTSFLFGSAFAVGWTPCVTAALGAILALAAYNPSSAFFLLFAYTLGLGLPFLVVGLFTSQAKKLIDKSGKWLKYFQYVFGVIMILLGILVFTGQLSKIANLELVSNFLVKLDIGTKAGARISSLNLLNLGIAFIAGLASFLSPCVLPLVPGFLSYLATTATTSMGGKERD